MRREKHALPLHVLIVSTRFNINPPISQFIEMQSIVDTPVERSRNNPTFYLSGIQLQRVNQGIRSAVRKSLLP